MIVKDRKISDMMIAFAMRKWQEKMCGIVNRMAKERGEQWGGELRERGLGRLDAEKRKKYGNSLKVLSVPRRACCAECGRIALRGAFCRKKVQKCVSCVNYWYIIVCVCFVGACKKIFAKKSIFFVEKLARFGKVPYICTRNQGMAP